MWETCCSRGYPVKLGEPATPLKKPNQLPDITNSFLYYHVYHEKAIVLTGHYLSQWTLFDDRPSVYQGKWICWKEEEKQNLLGNRFLGLPLSVPVTGGTVSYELIPYRLLGQFLVGTWPYRVSHKYTSKETNNWLMDAGWVSFFSFFKICTL